MLNLTISDGRILLGNVPASDLVRRFGSPLYAYDARVIRDRLERLRQHISHRPLDVYYAIKANPAPAILRLLHAQDIRVDACSPGDLAFAATAGFTEAEISYVSHSISDPELQAVARSDVFFIADSLSQLERIGALSAGREIGLRINCDIVAGPIQHAHAGSWDSKFGIHPGQVPDALGLATEQGLRVVGLHSHISSDILEPEAHLAVLAALLRIGQEVEHLHFVDIGGGWGVPFLPTDADYDMETFGREASQQLASFSQTHARGITLRLEPGSYLLMESGVLLVTVNELKPSVDRDGKRTPNFASVDASSNQLISAVIYDAYHPVWIADRANAPGTDTYSVTGHLMQGADILTHDRTLPSLEPGDVLVLGRAGAYSSCRAPNFNERPRPAEVLVDGSDVQLIRRAETEKDLLRPFLEVGNPASGGSK